MKIPVIMITLLLSSCALTKQQSANDSDDISFFVGTYTQNESKGIYKYSINKFGKLNKIGLVAQSQNPSFLAKSDDGNFLVTVNENGNGNQSRGGTLESYRIVNDSLIFVNSKPSGGDFPCFVTINSKGYVLTANYGNGAVGLLQLTTSGNLTDLLDIQYHKGSGSTPRQKSPHAHSVWFGEEEQELISIDLGTNELWFSKIDTSNDKLVPSNQENLKMEEGAGPRHMAFHPNKKWAYVVNELSSTVTLLKESDSGIFTKMTSITTLPIDFSSENSCADIHISEDGKFVYASNRGHDSLVIYEVDPIYGHLKLVGYESTRGKVPRNFALTPNGNFIVVANQNSNTLISFKRDKQHGTLKFIDEIDAPTPVCIVF